MTDLSTESGEDTEDEELPENYDGPYKMVFVVNMDLGMGVGKIAAQVVSQKSHCSNPFSHLWFFQ